MYVCKYVLCSVQILQLNFDLFPDVRLSCNLVNLCNFDDNEITIFFIFLFILTQFAVMLKDIQYLVYYPFTNLVSGQLDRFCPFSFCIKHRTFKRFSLAFFDWVFWCIFLASR